MSSQYIPLRNAGNIPLDVILDILDLPDVFSVMPSHIRIDPGNEAEVLVKFKPNDGDQKTKER